MLVQIGTDVQFSTEEYSCEASYVDGNNQEFTFETTFEAHFDLPTTAPNVKALLRRPGVRLVPVKKQATGVRKAKK